MADRIAVHDFVVVIPGILGSRLSRNGTEVWGASAGAVLDALKTFGRSLKDLQLPDDIGDGEPNDGVTATGLMNDLQIVPGLWTPNRGYDLLLDWLRSTFELNDVDEDVGKPGNLLPFAYDWRVSNRLTARRLRDVVEPALDSWRQASAENREARLVFLCHSMGGLVARYYLECLGGAASTRALVTFGTPHRGSLNAVETLVHGESKGWWRFRVDLTAMVRSLPSLYQLLPSYACVDVAGQPNLMRLDEVEVTELQRSRVADALRFHREIVDANQGHSPEYSFDAIVGIEQPTFSSARLAYGTVIPLETMRVTDANGAESVRNEFGDGTVPRLSAAHSEANANPPNLVWRSEQHGSLHRNEALLDHVKGVLTRSEIVWRDETTAVRPFIGIEVPSQALPGVPVEIGIRSGDDTLALEACTRDVGGQVVLTESARNLGDGQYSVRVTVPAPGAYEVEIRAPYKGVQAPNPVTGAFVVLPEDEMLS